MSDDKRADEQDENRRVVYQELCNSYRAIDDFRAKLLGFLPLATGTGIFLLVSNLISNVQDVQNPAPKTEVQNLAAKTEVPNLLTPETMTAFLWAAGAFGFSITLGLFFYEL